MGAAGEDSAALHLSPQTGPPGYLQTTCRILADAGSPGRSPGGGSRARGGFHQHRRGENFRKKVQTFGLSYYLCGANKNKHTSRKTLQLAVLYPRKVSLMRPCTLFVGVSSGKGGTAFLYPPATVKLNFMLTKTNLQLPDMSGRTMPERQQKPLQNSTKSSEQSAFTHMIGRMRSQRVRESLQTQRGAVPGAAAAPIGAARPENSVRKCKGLDILTIFAVLTTTEDIHRKSLHRHDNAALYPRRVGQCRPAVSVAVSNGKGGAVFHSRPKHKYNGKF